MRAFILVFSFWPKFLAVLRFPTIFCAVLRFLILERFSMTFTANGINETFAVCLQLSVQ